jgi:hypothetical protein
MQENPKQLFTKRHSFDTTIYNFYECIYNLYNKKYKLFDEKRNINTELKNMHLIFDTCIIEDNTHLQIPEIGKNDRKSVFIEDYHAYVDSNPEFIELYKRFIIDYVKPLYPEETHILYQKTPNLRISFPLTTAIGRRPDTDPDKFIIGLHNDSEFGHPPEEMNFVIPITCMFSTNSIYYEETPNSNMEYNEYSCLELVENEFFQCYFNQLKHYNRINGTGNTRISLDFRIIPYSKYNANYNETSITNNKKLQLGEYFELI